MTKNNPRDNIEARKAKYSRLTPITEEAKNHNPNSKKQATKPNDVH